jgi:ribosomal protein S18 acetylase RimI-like enzyme
MGDEEVTIKEITRHCLADVNKCDSSFFTNSKIVLSAENDAIDYTVVNIPPYQKYYVKDEVDYAAYVDHPDKTIFLAYIDRQVAGQIIMSRHWNQFAYIEDIAVDTRFRRRGIGQILLQQAIRWAREIHLAGVMLETQNINVAACRLYERCGFRLGGFDRCLYQGMNPGTEEIALFWYLRFPSD